jgi:membrane-associated HD superfamily phosphohydrolase
MSALIIISHVKEGVDLALKYHLNLSIIDGIQQHHGNSLVYYFYKRALQQQSDALEGLKIMQMKDCSLPAVEESTYRYPGPKPQTKEVGLLCLADSIEAASRGLDKPSFNRVDELVRDIIAAKVNDGQLDQSHLTLNDLRAAGEAMAATVKNMLHSRIAYAKKGEKVSDSALTQPTKRSSYSPSHAPEAVQVRAGAAP